MNHLTQPTVTDIFSAAERLRPVVNRTPVVRSDLLDNLVGAKVFLKLENMQHTGAFKFRGAYNCLSQIDLNESPDGVVAYSTGNHGQAVATVGRMLDIPTIVVMPTDAPANKIQKAKAQGATVILYDRQLESREAVAEKLAKDGRYTVVPPGDHPHVIAGQGTIVLEILEDVSGNALDIVLVPCGGGGLAAGTCLGLAAAGVPAQVWAAEPSTFNDTERSLQSGQRETNQAGATSICDALQAPTPAVLPFSINQKGLSGVLLADDDAVLRAMRFLFDEFRVVAEPGGAVALAALLNNPPESFSGKNIVVIISGGNVDPALFTRALGL